MPTEQQRTVQHGYFHAEKQDPVSASARQFFVQNGFVILTGFSSDAETEALRAAAVRIVGDFQRDPPAVASVFSTQSQAEKVLAQYFLASAANVSCFLEEKQQQQQAGGGGPRAVNKIGHALHELDPAFARFSRQARVRAAALALGVLRPVLAQSMYILKGARVGGEVRAHRDATFVRSAGVAGAGVAGACLGLWWALQDATEENGCLWAVPGSHRDEPALRFEANADRTSTRFVGRESVDYPPDRFVPLPMRRGDLILLHGAVVHMSRANTSAKSRHAYSVHVVDGAVAPDCWLQRPAHMPFRVLE